MSVTAYLKDRRLLLAAQALGLAGLGLYFGALELPLWQTAFILLFGLMLNLVVLLLDYLPRRSYQKRMERTLDSLEEAYLITELLPPPEDAQGQFYYDVLSRASRAMANQVQQVKVEQREYRDYVEALVHELKNPLAAMQMVAGNHPSEQSDAIMDELSRMEYYLEQALFFAKAQTLNQDYMVRPVRLNALVSRVLRHNARLLIGAGISIELSQLDVTVYSDEKWLEFILNQVVVNAAKYTREIPNRRLRIQAEPYEQGVRLELWDNGLGIPSEETDQVFQKGFVGTTGRKREASTGLGLYLARLLCEGLGHRITLESAQGSYTQVTLWFPKQELLD